MADEKEQEAPGKVEDAKESPLDNLDEETVKNIKSLREENKERRLKAEALQEELNTFKQAKKDEANQVLEEQGEFKKLHQTSVEELKVAMLDNKTLEERLATLQKQFDDMATSRLEQVPEQYRELLEGLPAAKQIAWMDKNLPALTNPKNGPPGFNPPDTSTSPLSDIDRTNNVLGIAIRGKTPLG